MRRLLAGFVFAAAAFPAALSVNGICQVGNCGSPDVLPSATSRSTSFNFVVTLPNSDQFRIVGNVNSSSSANSVNIVSPYMVMYIGNKTGTSSAADFVSVDVFQNFQLGFTLRQSDEVASGAFSGPLAAGSSAQIQLVINGQALPVMGPFVAPAPFLFTSPSAAISATTAPSFVVHHIYSFAAGSGVGSTIYNALTPTGTLGNTSNDVCDMNSSSTGCTVVACDGVGSSLPIDRRGPQPLLQALDTPAGSSCSLVGFDGTGSSLPILYPSGASGASGGNGSLIAFDGSGGTLPILYPTGPTGASGGGTGALIACDGGGSSLPIYRRPGASDHALASSSPFAMRIVTPFQSSGASYNASASCADSSNPCWLSVPVSSGSIPASSRAGIGALADLSGLRPGTYTGNVAVTITPTGQTPQTIHYPVIVAVSQPGAYLSLSQTGLQFQASAGSTVAQTQNIAISNPGAGTLAYTASVSPPSANWLTVSQPTGSLISAPAQVAIQANPTGLAAGVYSALVQFSGGMNGTQSLEVVLTVSTSGPPPSVSSNALVFTTNVGTNPAPQSVRISNPTAKALTANVGIGYAEGSGWLTTDALGNTIAPSGTLTETVSVNASGLAAGIYLGSMKIHFVETNTDQLVEVVLVVKGASCLPTRLLPVITNLGGGFQVTAGLPVPLAAQVVDDCGTPLASGSVMAYFPGGDLGVPLTQQAPGIFSGTWMPHSISATGPGTVALLASSTAPILYGSAGVFGTINANPQAPVVFSGGVVSSASYAVAPIAPGGRISIFGSNLAQSAENDNSPYQRTLGGTQVLLGGEPLPMQVTAPGLINAVLPYDIPAGVPQQLVVVNGGAMSLPETLALAPAQPSVFTLDASGQGAGLILVVHSDGSYFVNGSGGSATAGDALVIYAAGLGSVSPPVPAGTAAPASSTSQTTIPVTVTIGGISAPVAFAGLAPGFVGLYQINATVPPGIAPGANVPVVVSVGGASSSPVTVPIR